MEKSVIISISIKPDLLAKLKHYCKNNGKTVSGAIRQAIIALMGKGK